MKKLLFAILFTGLLITGCDKSDATKVIDENFATPDTLGDGFNPNGDDVLLLQGYRNYVFAGFANKQEEFLLTSGKDANVKFDLSPVLIPEGEIVDFENASFENPIVVELNGQSHILFNRSVDGRAYNDFSGWCLAPIIDGVIGDITEIRKYAPYGRNEMSRFAYGVVENELFISNKGMLKGDITSWMHYPYATFSWSNRDVSNYFEDIGGGAVSKIYDTKFGPLSFSESYAEQEYRTEIGSFIYEVIDFKGGLPVYGDIIDTTFIEVAYKMPRAGSLLFTDDDGQTWNDIEWLAQDTVDMLSHSVLCIDGGDYDGSIIQIGYSQDGKSMNQAVYQYADVDVIDVANDSTSITFVGANTNITNEIAGARSVNEIILNPVTNRVELIETFTSKIIIWSIGVDEIFNGSAEWTKELELLNRGDVYSIYSSPYSLGSVIDEENGVQHLYLSLGGATPSRKAIYKLSRDLDTPALKAWIESTRDAGKDL